MRKKKKIATAKEPGEPGNFVMPELWPDRHLYPLGVDGF